MLSFTIGRSTISIFLDGDFFTIDDSHANYQPLKDELNKLPDDRDLGVIRSYVSLKRMIEKLMYGRVGIDDLEVTFNGSRIANYMAERMLEMVREGGDVSSYGLFMNNVMDNPAAYTHDELYEWMEKAKMPITPDGCFLAFKKIRADYTDCHTGKFDHSLGTIVEMDRKRCDPNRNNHCSTGFHFCSVGYLSSFGGQRVVVVKINPKDVTSIPSDYQFTKGRTCRYEVIAELSAESAARHECWKKGVVNLENPAEFPADVLSKIKFPTPVLNEPVQADSDPEEADEALQDMIHEEVEAAALAALEETPIDQPVVIGSIPGVTIAAGKTEDGVSTVSAVVEAPATLEEAQQDVDAFEDATGEEIVFSTSDGREFSATVVIAALNDASIRGAARNLGIQDSTLRGWKKKLGL